MNRSAIKNFAIWARRYLREQVTARATQYGITRNNIIEAQAVTGSNVLSVTLYYNASILPKLVFWYDPEQ